MRRLAVIACALVGGVGLLIAGSAASDDGGSYEVRAIFDNASFLVPGEEVRVAGARVGQVGEVDVTRLGEAVSLDGKDEPGKAAVVLEIDDEAFQDFRQDSSCIIQPQSVLGEKYVGCDVTQPRSPDAEPPPPLEEIPEGQPGEGQRLLPLENNGKAVDIDLVNNIMREPYADRFRLILNDLGAGFAARGEDLEEIVERANPALRQTERVLEILAQQNRTLAELARDSDTVLEPLARERRAISGFIRNSTVPAQATAERSEELEAGLERFPRFLREFRPTMVELRKFSDTARPVIADFGAAAPEVDRLQRALVPLNAAAIPALQTLGEAADASVDDIVASDPVIKDTRDLARAAEPASKQLRRLLASFERGICVRREAGTGECADKTTGFKSLMDFIFNTSAAVNGFDQYGHFLRTFGLVTNCTRIVSSPTGGCNANFVGGEDVGVASVAKLLDGAKPSESKRRPYRPRGRKGERTARPEQAPPAPTPDPAQPEPLVPQDEQQGDIQPEPGDPLGSAGGRSARAGKALLRFLIGDGR